MFQTSEFDAFWLDYLRAHSHRLTRLIHYCGVTVIFAGIIAAIWTWTWWLALAGIVAGYAIAFAAHFTVQGNRPVMFKGAGPALWSIVSALRMYFLGVSGRLGPELKRAGVRSE